MKKIFAILILAFAFTAGMAVNRVMAQGGLGHCASYAKANHCHATWSRQSFSCVCAGK
jgi:hypothetical protein